MYVHIPFCASRCDYCAFATWTDRHDLIDAYARACRSELGRAVEDGMPAATSVFFGGGTPSQLPGDVLVSILDAVPRVDEAEITVECNPEDVTSDLLATYRAAGVNRASLGAQSLAPHVLDSLGRRHAADAVGRSASLVRAAGFDRCNIDLIFGAVGETDEDWAATLDGVLAMGVGHISAYALTVEAGTPLAADPARHPDEDVEADRYALADARLRTAGLANYEISNWARPGHECRHNRLYWSQGEYRGIGCAAHSHAVDPSGRARRWWNVRTPERYIDLVSQGERPIGGQEILEPATRRDERVQLALRTRDGVPLDWLGARGTEAVREFPELVEIAADDRLVLTAAGRLMANAVAVRLIADA